eukprot:6186594-Pleurochrysis_carterae.AAC.3
MRYAVHSERGFQYQHRPENVGARVDLLTCEQYPCDCGRQLWQTKCILLQSTFPQLKMASVAPPQWRHVPTTSSEPMSILFRLRSRVEMADAARTLQRMLAVPIGDKSSLPCPLLPRCRYDSTVKVVKKAFLNVAGRAMV